MEKQTKNILTASAATATAAAAIVGGYALFNNGNEQIDWSIYDLNIPELSVDLGIPTLDVDLGIPNLDVLNGKTTTINIATNVNTNVNINVVDLKAINQIEITKNIISKQMSQLNEDIKSSISLLKQSEQIFIDKRNINRDMSLYNKNTPIKEWIKIYKEYKDKEDIKYIPIQKPFKMITEVRVPINTYQMNILMQNLTYYKSQGYDSVLVAFTKDDSPKDVLNTIKFIIKNSNMNVWATYTGNQNLRETVFMDVDTYTKILTNIAPYIKGYINSWRRTSSHLWVQDEVFMKYTNITLRSANPNLPIVGEIYYGNSYKYDSSKKLGFVWNIFNNASGIMFVNFGYEMVDADYLINVVLKKYIKNVPLIGCVVGQRPYYLNRYKNNLTYKENMLIKHKVEQKFLDKGCIGVITLSDDGYRPYTNNLSETLYTKLGK